MNNRAFFDGMQVGQARGGLTKLRPHTQQPYDTRLSIPYAHQVFSTLITVLVLGQIRGHVASITEVHNNRIRTVDESGTQELQNILMVC